MSHLPAILHDLYPLDAALLRNLKSEDAHFQHLAERLETLDSAVHAIDSGEDPASDERAEAASRDRIHLLDEIAGIIAAARKAV